MSVKCAAAFAAKLRPTSRQQQTQADTAKVWTYSHPAVCEILLFIPLWVLGLLVVNICNISVPWVMVFCMYHSCSVVDKLLQLDLTKFLGMIFDRKLSFIPHLYCLKEKCLKAINLLRVVAHTTWGADQQTLLHLYRSSIRSKLDYGCIVYGSARPSYLKILEPIHNHALHLCLGAFQDFTSSQFMCSGYWTSTSSKT